MNNIKSFDDFSEDYDNLRINEEKESSKSDEQKYLSAKQRKLPEALKKGIIERAKKKESESDKDEDED